LLAFVAPVNDTYQDGNKALHWALKQDTPLNGCSVNCLVVEKLLDVGATVTSGNNTGPTLVHTVAGHGHLEALLLIIKKHGGSINILTGTRETPLHYVVKNNHLACVSLLLRHGANRDVKGLRNQKPIQLAHSSEMSALLSLHDKEFLDEACDNIITSQSCILPTIKQSTFSGKV
jgi:ankyrin repeat protein